MTNSSKINGAQKRIMADFMSAHQNLARNLLNCVEGKATAKHLWGRLTIKLNKSGPPVKNATQWRKVYADQKFHVKKKIDNNKFLTSAEEQIFVAAIVDTVEASPVVNSSSSINVRRGESEDSVDNPLSRRSSENSLDESDNNISHTNLESFEINECIENKHTPATSQKRRKNAVTKLVPSEKNIEKTDEWRWEVLSSLQSLVVLKQRSLEMKEEKHIATMQIKQMELEKKTLELELLKRSVKQEHFDQDMF